MDNATIEEIHISQVRVGDAVIRDGHTKTVSPGVLNRGFMGITLWGDSYKLGTIPVLRVKFGTPQQCKSQ